MTMLLKTTSQRALTLPLVLISQVQRSGGTLLSQLFDAHPEVLAFPSELHLVKAGWQNWAQHLPDTKEMLATHDRTFRRFTRDGYHKFALIDEGDRHELDYDFDLRDRTMAALLQDKAAPSNRDMFDAFFTAFFAAWRSRKTATARPRCIVAFAARTNMFLAQAPRPPFFADYPDGHLISLIRRPLSWFASARRHGPAYEDLPVALDLWTQSAHASLLLRDMFPGQVTLLTFESLVARTEHTMRALCRRLGLGFAPVVCTPTFDGRPIKSDSNFQPSYGVDSSVLRRGDFVPATRSDRQLCEGAERLYEAVARTALGPQSEDARS